MHPVWTFVMVFSIIMAFISFYEGPKLLKNIEDKKTKAYALIGLISVWGVIALLANEKAGF